MQTKIFDYGMNGEGVAKVDGKVVLIDNSLVDEVVDVEIEKDNGNFAIGKVKKIVEPSPNRTTPPCPYFYECGGCQLQHMTNDEQIKFKSLNIKKTLKKISNLDVDVNPTVACSTPFHYRNKMSFSVKDKACGLLKNNSKEIVNISHCPLTTSNINKVFEIFKNYISTNPKKVIKNLVVRDIENQVLVGVVTSKHIDLKDFHSMLSSNFEKIGIYEIINTRNDSVVLSGQVNHVVGIKEIEIHNFGLTYSVDLMGFHQTNLEIQNKLYEKVLEYISPNSVVLNGFSGQGLLSAIIAQKAKHVIGIEINKSSHMSAEKLKTDNKIINLKNICGDFFKEIGKIKLNADTLILDPTKKGCGKQVMSEIIGFENIIYISCNPIALCKDLNIIKNEYKIEEITPFDMFPNTTSVETLVKLKRRKIK